MRENNFLAELESVLLIQNNISNSIRSADSIYIHVFFKNIKKLMLSDEEVELIVLALYNYTREEKVRKE
jgi:hypothetical protein